ncbi:hydroxypyruvate isomerase [Photobacterium ganghwense]|uniref:Hydroxypyruvate isomerase n=1 Tax=Photobacterium ganghwense TaxID=320778 RepID=A0A0J1HFK5_9GAMM|nr:hydroxypyruvate isomerase [Photobacterium ganghwense]KLV10398.1 hydroxypyruvate isomerase [Photobacterium ganghwense]PSU09707.1 hydroxypyruvate isomerase [Photobacterium ganghwense]QSV16954.1 hydroxypyruvate isomerase [Photobacterium ganghwense]
MPKFAANLSMLFTEHAFLDRFEAAAKAGFDGVEYLFPYDFPAEEIKARLSEYHLQQVLFNLPAGDWDAGERGIAVDPSRVQAFRDGVPKAIAYAKALGCTQVNCLAGIVPQGVSAQEAHRTFVDNLRFASQALEAEGIRLVIEAINTRDIPGFFLNTTEQGKAVIAEVGSTNLSLQYDIYHMQIMEGDLATTLTDNLVQIGHVQLADNPGRHEPGTGEINYPFVLSHLDSLGYEGWVGCEYKPKTTTLEGLNWLNQYR